MPNPQNLKSFKKGEDNRRNLKGRPKGKLRDIKEVISNLLTQEKNNSPAEST